MARPRIEQVLASTTFRLSKQDLHNVRVAAEKDLRSPSQWIRIAVKEKLEREQNG